MRGVHFQYRRPYCPESSAEKTARALNGRRSGTGWIARCPAHEDRNPSLTITEAGGKILVHCHAGCSQEAVIEALRSRGLWPERRREWLPREEYLRRLRARREAERRARTLAEWRREQRSLLIRLRNLFWDLRRAAETWLENEGRKLDFANPQVIWALEAVSDPRPEAFERAIEVLERLEPRELVEVHRRLSQKECWYAGAAVD